MLCVARRDDDGDAPAHQRKHGVVDDYRCHADRVRLTIHMALRFLVAAVALAPWMRIVRSSAFESSLSASAATP